MKGWHSKFWPKRQIAEILAHWHLWDLGDSRTGWASNKSMGIESKCPIKMLWLSQKAKCMSWACLKLEQKRFDGISTAVYPKHVCPAWAGLVPQASVARRSRGRKTWCVEPEHSFLDMAKPLHIKLFGSEFQTAPCIWTTEVVRRCTATKPELLR